MTRRRLARTITARTLQTLLDQSSGRLPLEPALRLARSVVSAVARLHQQGTLASGLCASSFELSDDGGVTVNAGGAGPRAPELLAGAAPSVASDVYAVGGVLFELLTGLTVAQARSRSAVPRLHTVPAPSRFNPTLPDVIDELLPRLLAARPDQRPASLGQVLATLDEGLEELGLEAAPERTALAMVPPPFRPARAAVRRAPEPIEDSNDDDADDELEARAAEPAGAAWLIAAVGFTVMALVMVLL